MSTDDRLRAKIASADAALRSEPPDWNSFAERAHRRLALRRSLAFAAVAALVVVGGIGSRALISAPDTKTLPANNENLPLYEERPVDVGQASSTCPQSPRFETGKLGAVAYFRAGELRVVDLNTNQDRLLVSGLEEFISSTVSWSPNGKWISAGGYVAPAVGGAVCAPLGAEASSVQWAAEDLMVAQGRGGLVIGGPGRERRELQFEQGNALVSSFEVNPITTIVAVSTVSEGDGGAALWTVDPQSGQTSEVAVLSDEGVEAKLAGWSPDGQWILFWEVPAGGASLAADGVPLYAVESNGGEPVEVVDIMLPHEDFLTWCGDTLVATAGGDRFVTAGKSLIAMVPPQWDASKLAGGSGRSVFWASCSPDGAEVAATSTPEGPEDPIGSVKRRLDFFSLGTSGKDSAGMLLAPSSEFPLWPKNQVSEELGLLHVRRSAQSEAGAAIFLDGKRADLGTVAGFYGHYSYSDVFDWYQP